MREICTESVVTIQPKTIDRFGKYLLFVFIGAAFLSIPILRWVSLALIGIFSFLLYRQFSKTNAEYDYVHTNDIFDVDLVTMGRFRKQLCSIDLDHVILVAKNSSPEMEKYQHLKASDYTGNHSVETIYAMVYSTDRVQKKLLLQLDDRMLRSLTQWIPGKMK